jgi:4-alpha-glucanotransferase
MGGRRAGVVLPLFALRAAGDWGIGEIGHLSEFVRWLARAEQRVLLLLPFHEIPAGERSPYSAVSSFAIDPIFLSLEAVEDFARAGGENALPPVARARLAAARADPAIDYDGVRAVKLEALALAFDQFSRAEGGDARRAADFRRFEEAEGHWLPTYTLWRVLAERHGDQPWSAWEPELRDGPGETAALAASPGRRRFHSYVQWQAAAQWAAVHCAGGAAGVTLLGDLPFMIAASSADVWAAQDEFQIDARLGAPPDAFRAEGQDWNLPVPCWERMAAGGFTWLRARVARAAALFEGLRLDHVVGYYRMHVRTRDGVGFVPADEGAQLARGEQLLDVVRDAAGGTTIVGEDLGAVPDFVRRALARLDIPGYRVLRWETEGQAFRDPRRYPRRSVATSGTHDTASLAMWWEDELQASERRALAAVPAFAPLATLGARWSPEVHSALLDGLYAAGSELVLLPFEDASGERVRINAPGTVGRGNWKYRMPWGVDQLEGPEASALADRLAALARRHRRV